MDREKKSLDIWLPFLKTVFFLFLKNIERKENNKNTVESKKNTNFREQEQFLENTKMMIFAFSRTVLKNNF